MRGKNKGGSGVDTRIRVGSWEDGKEGRVKGRRWYD